MAAGVGSFASGLTYVPEVIAVYSPPICAGDAGPCPLPHALPPPIEAHWA
jgi:hypothetical protein